MPDMLAAFRRLGWELVRQRSSHVFLHYPPTGQDLVLVVHQREIGHNYLIPILREAGVSVEDYIAALKGKRAN